MEFWKISCCVIGFKLSLDIDRVSFCADGPKNGLEKVLLIVWPWASVQDIRFSEPDSNKLYIHISMVITIQHKRGPISRSQQSPAIQNVYDIVAEPEPWFVVLISALRSQRNLALLASGMKETRRNIHLLTKRPKIGRNLFIRFLCESLPSACNNENYTYPGLSDDFWNVWYQ